LLTPIKPAAREASTIPEGAPEGADELSLAEGVMDDDFALDDNEEPAASPPAVLDNDSEDEDESTNKLRRGNRERVPSKRVFGEEWTNYQAGKDPKQKIHGGALNQQYLNALNWKLTTNLLQSNDLKAMMSLIDQNTDPEHNTIEWMHPMIFGSKANSEDNPTWEEAMNGPNRAGYWEACEKELETLKGNKDAWDVVDHEPWMNVLPSTWAFNVSGSHLETFES